MNAGRKYYLSRRSPLLVKVYSAVSSTTGSQLNILEITSITPIMDGSRLTKTCTSDHFLEKPHSGVLNSAGFEGKVHEQPPWLFTLLGVGNIITVTS